MKYPFKIQCPHVFNVVHELYIQSQILSNSSVFSAQFRLKSGNAMDSEVADEDVV